jgi:D-alanyl-lipoteichoic acid acyltransferase DltB (MBOAT superfamily)
MNLADSSFLLFLAAVAPLYGLLARWLGRIPVTALVFTSLFFYATWNPLYLLPLLTTATTDYLVGRGLGRLQSQGARRLLVGLSLVVDVGLLLSFKAFDLLVTAWTRIQGLPQIHLGWRLVFMTGISFYTFQSLSYVFDVYRRDQAPEASFFRYLAFVSFFPTLLAGPITRAETLLPQFAAKPRAMDPGLASRALFLIALGFVKKGMADHLAVQLVDRVFDQPLFYSSLELLSGIYAYAVQIYCDFSGYSDIAIGAALLLGFQLKDNFNAPYRAASLAEFWQRWHISFSTWLRDYVFFSLPGNRKGSPWPYPNLAITFVVGGLWHGVSWPFAIWGMIHGVGMAVERFFTLMRRGPARPQPVWRKIPGAFLTFHVVLVAWVFFRCETLDQAREIATRLADLTTGHGNVPGSVLALIVCAIGAQWLPEDWLPRLRASFTELPALIQGALLAGVAVLVRFAAASQITPFIYQRF